MNRLTTHTNPDELERLRAQVAAMEQRLAIYEQATTHNSTELDQALADLHHKNTNLEQISQELQDIKYALDRSTIVAITDAKGTITVVNDKFCEISKYNRDELIGQNHRILNSGHHPREFFVEMWQTIAQGQTWRAEIQNRAKDGSLYWVDTTIVPFLNDQGKPYQYLAIRADITARKLAEVQLANLVMLQQVLLDSANFSIISTNLDGTIQSFNAAAESMLGYRAAEVLGQVTPAILHEPTEVVARAQQLSIDLQQPIQPGFEVFVAQAKLGLASEHEWTYIRKDGSRFPVLLSVTAIRDAQGEMIGFLGIAKDITTQKQAEKQLTDITAALDQTAIVAITDVQGTITFVNDKFCKISNYNRDELIGQNHRILNSGHHPRQFFVEMWQTIAHGQTWRAEIKNRAKDGSFYWVDTTIVPFLNDQGKPYQYLAIRTDITARKAAEVELRQLSLIASQTNNIAIITNPQGQIEWVNESFNRVTGYSLDEVIGQRPGSFLQGPNTSQETVAAIRYALAHKQPFSGEILNYHKDGHSYWLLLNINPVLDDDGQVTHFIAIETDITSRKQIESDLKQEVEDRTRVEQELRTLSEQLKASNRELQDFAYVSSHDLQEPLRKIQAFGDRLKSTCQDSLNEKGLDYLERMLNAAGRAQVLINDLLAFARVTTKAQPFEPVDMSEVVAGVLSDLEIRIEQAEARVDVDSLPVVEADPLQMRQLLQNLLSNALKFRQAEVAPVVQVRSRLFSDNGQDWCEIRIIDNGIGFEQKYTDRIFQIFQRLHGRDSYEGTGIGLAICRKIAERHGGTLTAQSDLNQGATFTFTLPIIHHNTGDDYVQ